MAKSWIPDTSISFKDDKNCTLGNDEDIRFVDLGNEDFDEVIDLLRQYFVPFEPINLGLGCSFQNRKERLKCNVRHYLECELSIGTRSTDGKLVGVILADIERRDDPVRSNDDLLVSEESKNMIRHTLEVLNHMTNSYDVFQDQGVNEVLYQAIGCVHPEYQCRGISRAMKEKVEQKAIAAGIRVAYSIGTSVKSQASLQRTGYVAVYEAQYNSFDFLDLQAMGNNRCAKLMVKKLV